MASVYILYSDSLKRFYTGATTLEVEERLQHHLKHYYNNKFTHNADDWTLFLEFPCHSVKQAFAVEARMKSSRYIHNLKLYPELITKLLDTYKDS